MWLLRRTDRRVEGLRAGRRASAAGRAGLQPPRGPDGSCAACGLENPGGGTRRTYVVELVGALRVLRGGRSPAELELGERVPGLEPRSPPGRCAMWPPTPPPPPRATPRWAVAARGPHSSRDLACIATSLQLSVLEPRPRRCSRRPRERNGEILRGHSPGSPPERSSRTAVLTLLFLFVF